LSSLAVVRTFARQLLVEVNGKVNILINDAAGPGATNDRTADGFNLEFEIDYLGPFLLTELLLPALRATAKATNTPSRVINIASDVHIHACEVAGWKLVIAFC
jgi:NAD(P)-dependent dehydrogenase (short-subunit alcohol dehydrogenase family)